MHYIVCPVRPAGGVNMDGVSMTVSDKVARDSLKEYCVDEAQANTKATALASKHPGVQFAVFSVRNIFECLIPPPPKVIRKTMNENGEIVMVQS